MVLMKIFNWDECSQLFECSRFEGISEEPEDIGRLATASVSDNK